MRDVTAGFFANCGTALGIFNSDGVAIQVNAAWQNTLPWEKDSFPGVGWLRGVHSEDLVDVRTAFADFKRTPERRSLEIRYQMRDGMYRWLSWELTPTAGGESICAVIHDLTERNATEFFWRENEARFRIIFEFAPMGLIQVDDDGGFVKTNLAFQKMTGYSEAELRRLSLDKVVHPEDRDKSPQQIRTAQPDFMLLRQRLRLSARNGETVWAQITTGHHPETVGRHLISIVENINAQVASEKELEKQRQALFANAKMASLGEMAAGMAHEVNNPLAVLLTRLHLLERQFGIDDKVFHEHIEVMTRNAVRIEKIVQGLKTYSRHSSADPFSMTPVGQLFEDVQALVGARFKNSGTQIRYLTESQNGQFECRPAEIVQVLINLVTNAHDAIQELPDRWIEIKFKSGRNDVEFRVTDSGNGIAVDVADRLFDPFFTTKEVGKGTGLGLSISAGIVERHGGKLWLDPAAPHTTFVLQMPRTHSGKMVA